MWLSDEGLEMKYLIRDRDALYPEQLMKAFWESEGVKVIKTPVQSPKANSFVESYIGKCKRECLNHLTCFHPSQLNYISQQWCAHYNSERPHRGKGIDNNVLDVDFTPQTEGQVKCKQRLGGLLKSYYREAA